MDEARFAAASRRLADLWVRRQSPEAHHLQAVTGNGLGSLKVVPLLDSPDGGALETRIAGLRNS